MYWFTGDQHFGHANIIKHCNRPFQNVHEMNCELIQRHNAVVHHDDTVIHCGDFALDRRAKEVQRKYLSKLKGNHVFIRGNHDKWLKSNAIISHDIWEASLNGKLVIVTHYAMRVWNKSHYGSINLHGHSHGKLAPFRNQYDIGVDNNNYSPISLNEIIHTKLGGAND